ncbi:MAG: hypothetical protein Q7S57_05875 [bacterium]|nr:hypothetical protein [bacterium]
MESNTEDYGPDEADIEKIPQRPQAKIKLLSVDAAELVTCDKEASAILCDTYIYDPDESEAKLGSLYLVLETVNSSERASEVTDAVSIAIRKEYFRDPNRNMYDSLEEALKQANHVLSDYVEQGELDWVENFHAAACAFLGQNVHISRVGDAELLLVRKGRLTDIGEGLSDPNLRRPHHAFTSVASGTVAENDVLLLATPQLSHLIPNDRLNHMVSSKTPSEVITLLQSLLDDSKESTTFALLLLQFSKLPERLPAPAVPLNMPKKVNLTHHEPIQQSAIRSRRPIPLKRSFWGTLLRIIKQISSLGWKFTREKFFPAISAVAVWTAKKTGSLASATARGTKQMIKSRKSPSPEEATEIENAEEDHVDEIALENQNEFSDSDSDDEFISDTVSYSEETGEKAPKESLVKRFVFPLLNFTRKFLKPLFSFKNAPKTTKILLAVVIVFIIIFIFGVRALSQKKKVDTAINGVAQQLEQARAKKDNADSALIYNNQQKAKIDLQEALNLANQINKSGYYKDESDKLIVSIQEIQDRMEKVTRINTPNLAGDFASIAGTLKTPAMVNIERNVFTFDPVTNAIYSLNLDTKETKVASQTSQGIGYFRGATPLFAEKSILFTTDTPGLAMFDTQRSELLKQEVKLPTGLKSIDASSIFGSRLYLLSTAQKIIYGFSKTLSGYDGGNAWLTDKSVSVERATGMGVDGYIYLLMDDGKIVKMLKGKPVEFKQENMTTPVVKPSRLLIYDGIKHLYVLDQAQKRVLVYDTVGNLTNQFVFPNTKELRDIAISSKEETLYVLDETRVYSVQLKAPIITPTPVATN